MLLASVTCQDSAKNIVACLLKARTVEPEGVAIARELHSKLFSVVTDAHATMETLRKWCLLGSPHWGYMAWTQAAPSEGCVL
jgi:hypothetical protein